MPAPGPVAILPISQPSLGRNNYQGFHPGKTEVLPKGWSQNGQKPIECDIKVEHDICITVRDGAKLYVDIYRPANEDVKVPAILSWSPFGMFPSLHLELQATKDVRITGKKYNGLTMLKMTPCPSNLEQSL
jgi:hypothetical protein